jgi:hypothetical protein
MTGDALAAEAGKLLDDPALRDEMRNGLREVSDLLRSGGDAIERAAEEIWKLDGERIGVIV